MMKNAQLRLSLIDLNVVYFDQRLGAAPPNAGHILLPKPIDQRLGVDFLMLKTDFFSLKIN